MDVLDHESHPIQLAPKALINLWPWLFKEIFLSGMNVSRIILDPKLPISPTVDLIPSSQNTDVGRSTFANSITLTPGTVAIEIKKNFILVHSIEKKLIVELQSGDMDSKVTNFERTL